MPLGPAENLTPEQVTELVLTLTGRLQAALEAPLEERGTAQRRMIDALVRCICLCVLGTISAKSRGRYIIGRPSGRLPLLAKSWCRVSWPPGSVLYLCAGAWTLASLTSETQECRLLGLAS